MKKFILSIISIMTLAASDCLLAQALPGTVQAFMWEQSISQHPLNKSLKRTFAPPRLVNGIEMVDAFIEIENGNAASELANQGVIVECEFDGFVTAKIPVDRLTRIAQMQGVKDVEISRLMEFCTDQTLSLTHASQVLDGLSYGLPQPYDGNGVIVGIIDAGFDYQHYAFRDATKGLSRITRVYDVLNATGHPAFVGTSQLSGSVFMGEQIDTLTTDCDGTHGTHTASIAAGTHYMGYGGMAPAAEIVLCAAHSLYNGLTQSEVANCLKYIYAYADSVGKPCVVSLSVSTYNNSHDGTDFLSRAVAQCVGPGKVFVIAAGNNAGNYGENSRYVHGPATMDKPLNFKLIQHNEDIAETDNTTFYRSLWFEAWCRSMGSRPAYQFHIIDNRTRQIVWRSNLFQNMTMTIYDDEIQDYFKKAWYDNVGYLQMMVVYNSTAKKYAVRGGIYNLQSTSYTVDSAGVYNSNYQIGVTVYPPRYTMPSSTIYADSCYIDAWVNVSYPSYFGMDQEPVYVENEGVDTLQRIDDFYAQPSNKCTINSIATHDSIISAGSFAGHDRFFSFYRDSLLYDTQAIIGDIYPSSSYQESGYGPTGMALPTVCAPGVYVVAAGSRYSYFRLQSADANPNLVMKGPDRSLWGVMTGTSMAAPTVAGIIAQWLQIAPTLSPSQVKDVIAHSAIKDQFTASPGFGPNGKIDALAGAKYLLHITDDEIQPGDVNGDGMVNIKDVTMLIDYLLTNNATDCVMAAMDVNQDGLINIKDVTNLIDMLLSGTN